jgi:hypothetical protein
MQELHLAAYRPADGCASAQAARVDPPHMFLEQHIKASRGIAADARRGRSISTMLGLHHPGGGAGRGQQARQHVQGRHLQL